MIQQEERKLKETFVTRWTGWGFAVVSVLSYIINLLFQRYSCGFGPGKYCAVENENFVIEFSNFRTSTSVVRLLVTARKTYDYEPPLLAAVVGGVLGGAVIVTVVAVVVIMFRIRKRRWRKPPPAHAPLPPPDPDRETCV
ncbi:uncharacterized protein [Argopecten irradians]|uniref:uncharacterized protein n=1 Tax=Argopecten irradians TaxID=31199 RepID=UPI00371EB14B